MNCDRIAPFYKWCEWLAFGGQLQKHRKAYLRAASGKQRVLILGDGDGRFVQSLALAYPDLTIDCVEMSAGMVRQARGRIASAGNVRIFHSDVFAFDFRAGSYDLVFTHFFLDCFDNAGVMKLVQLVSRGMTTRADWVVSDFRYAPKGWRRIYTGAWLKVMYWFFRLATGLETQRLPEYLSAFKAAGFRLREEQVSMAGLIASEWWERR